mmetsp:Transcript_28371/g.61737  ORF Transcript_28371/g.61737 Transcript_28371/m.61737 type:complete len:552 (+) Transcript_28371:86-1741(+)
MVNVAASSSARNARHSQGGPKEPAQAGPKSPDNASRLQASSSNLEGDSRGGSKRDSNCSNRRSASDIMKSMISEVIDHSEGRPRVKAASTTGRLNGFVDSTLWSFCVAFLIFLNALMIGIETDVDFENQSGEVQTLWAVQEYFFVIAFTVELMLRIWASGIMEFAFTGKTILWNYFDSVLVLLAILENCVLSWAVDDDIDLTKVTLLRVLRLLRIARLLKIIRIFQQLRLFIDGVFTAASVTFWGLLLISIVIYMCAIFVTRVASEDAKTDETMDDHWGTVLRSMFTLFQVTTGDSWASVVARPMVKRYPWMAIFFVLFIATTTFILLNLVVAMIVEHAVENAMTSEDDAYRQAREELKQNMSALFEVFVHIDEDGNRKISRTEFLSGINHPKVLAQLHAMDVTLEDTEELFDLIDIDGSGELTDNEFIEGCLRLRGFAKARHLLALSSQVHRNEALLKRMDKRMASMEHTTSFQEVVAAVQAAMPDAASNGNEAGHYAALEARLEARFGERLARIESLLAGLRGQVAPKGPSEPRLPQDDTASWVDPSGR